MQEWLHVAKTRAQASTHVIEPLMSDIRYHVLCGKWSPAVHASGSRRGSDDLNYVDAAGDGARVMYLNN